MKNARKMLVLAVALGVAASSQAITFSNVTMVFNDANLATGSFYQTGATDIDFFTPNFKVGDGAFGPARVGILTITYEAMSDLPMVQNEMVLSVLGGVAGSGTIQFSEVIEDLVAPGIIGSINNVTINNNAQLPFSEVITFSRATTKIKVKKDFLIFAEPDTNVLDFARVGLIEQNIAVVPEPTTLAAAGIGLVALLGRRRKK